MKHSVKRAIQVLSLPLIFIVLGFQNCSSSKEDPSPPSIQGSSNLFWVEPTASTTIGVGQIFNIYTALKNSSSDLYPSYLNASSVSFSSSNPLVASINSSGQVLGLSEGTTTISVQYQSHSTQLSVKVSGTMLQRTVTVAGQGSRSYYIYVPAFGSDTNPHPLLISLHGGGGSAMVQAAGTLLNKFADTQKIYVAYLEGSGAIKTFNAGACCGYAQSQGINDTLYVRAVINDIQANYTVNSSQMFASGFSNGGMMSHRLACELADKLSGIAAIGGGSAEFDNNLNSYYTCSPSRRIKILHIHAANDRNYPINGGVGEGLSSTAFYSIPSTMNDWISRNNLTSQSTVVNVTATTKCYHYNTVSNAGLSSAAVRYCVINPADVYDATNEMVFGGGHSWPGGVRSPSANSDIPVMDFNANSYLWNFLIN